MFTPILTFGRVSNKVTQPFQKIDLHHCITAVIFILLGVIISGSSFAFNNYQTSIRILIMTTGIGISIFGLVLCFKESVYNISYPLQDSVEEHHLYFDKKQKKTLTSIINVDGIPDCIKPTKSYRDVVRLDIFISEDCHFATLQLSQYKAGFFYPLTDVHYYSGADAKRISNLLDSYNKE
jgi:hypothetical protein